MRTALSFFWISLHSTSAGNYFYVGKIDEAVIACGGFYIVKDKPVANLVLGMVDKSHHGKGYGKQLFEFRINEIKIFFPNHAVILDTSQHTVGFFLKLGFKINKITPNGYGPGLDRYDLI